MIAQFIALSLVQAPQWGTHTPVDYNALTDAQHCEQMQRVVANVMRDIPMMVDSITRVDGMSIICGLRTVT